MRGGAYWLARLTIRNAALVPLIQDKAMECKFGVLETMRQTDRLTQAVTCVLGSILGGNPKRKEINRICLFCELPLFFLVFCITKRAIPVAGPARCCFFRDFSFKCAVFRLPALHESPRRLFRCPYRGSTLLLSNIQACSLTCLNTHVIYSSSYLNLIY